MARFFITNDGNIAIIHFESSETVNAWSGSLSVTGGAVGKVVVNNSIADIWQTPPRGFTNPVLFTGGTANGFSGRGELFRFDIAPTSTSTPVFVAFGSETASFLHDGLGTNAGAVLEGKTILIAQALRELNPDREPPARFTPQVMRDKSIFGNRALLVFQASDLESGINHYEIREVTSNGVIDWHEASSPYLINPDVQTIEVRAIDNALNERVAIVEITKPLPGTALAVSVVVIIALFVVGYIVLKRIWGTRSHNTNG